MSSNGRTPGSGPGGWGSSPYTPAQTYIIYAPVAQLDRVSGYGPEGWGFESSQAYWIFLYLEIISITEQKIEQ